MAFRRLPVSPPSGLRQLAPAITDLFSVTILLDLSFLGAHINGTIQNTLLFLAPFPQHNILLHVAVVHSLLFSTSLHGFAPQFIHLLKDVGVELFQFGTVTSKSATSIQVEAFLWICIFVSQVNI